MRIVLRRVRTLRGPALRAASIPSALGVAALVAAAISQAQANEPPVFACITCHPPSTSAHVTTWQASQHARAGVGCTDCHGGAPGGKNADGPHADADPTQMGIGAIEKMCGHCHAEVWRLFRASPFVKEGHPVENAPTCVTCHGTEGSGVITVDELGPVCGGCHRPGGQAGHLDVPVRAAHLLRELHRLSLTRVLVEEAIRQCVVAPQQTKQAAQAARADRQLRAVNRVVGDHILEWHRFDLNRVEANTRRALRQLGDIHEQVMAR